MARPKGKGTLRTFVFTVDAADPKYSKLIEYLENIDNGARSFVIRQALNSYICEQNLDFAPTNVITNTEIIKPDSSKQNKEDVKPIKTKKPTFKNKMSATNTPQKETKEEEKIVPSEGMNKLLNNFQ